jgi:hypothetical protein
MAAAVLASFDPLRLKPYGIKAEPGQALEELVDDSVAAFDSPGGLRWMLLTEVRNAALRRIATKGKAAFEEALSLNEGDYANNPLQEMLSHYIRRTAPPLEEQDVKQLRGSLEAALWLRSVLNVPDVDDIRQKIEEKQFIAPFEFLLADGFAGRTSEIEALRRYVGVIAPSRAVDRIVDNVRGWIGLKQRGPLILYGPGGIGKSTLIAKFVVEHRSVPAQQRFPSVYLDFDSPYLRIDQTHTWTIEAIRQIRIQYRALESDDAAIAEIETAARTLADEIQSAERSNEQRARDEAFIGLLAGAANAMAAIHLSQGGDSRRDPPLLIVFDSFEEVQYATPTEVDRLWELLEILQRQYATLRVVVSGRAPVEKTSMNKHRAEMLELKDFDQESALLFLRKNDIEDEHEAMAIFKYVGGNPLSLKLAADVVREEGGSAQGLSGLQTTSWLLFAANEVLIQGQLYTRILNRIPDEDVRKLAHPGLVLRRMSPDIIELVLQKPCGVTVRDHDHAVQLFDKFRRVVSLVTTAPDASIHHRPAVRRVMLRLLERDKPEKVAEIDAAAVRYYHDFADATSRAEEVYHLLRLGAEPSVIDARWRGGIEQFLLGAEDEIPASSRAYLAARLGKVDPALAADASQELWERHVERIAEDLLADGNAEEAVAKLHERSERMPASRLPLIEGRALLQLGRIEEAREPINKAINDVGASSNRDDLLAALELAVQLEVTTGNWDDASELLRRAESVARRIGDLHRELDFAVRRFRILELAKIPAEDLQRAADAIAMLFHGITDASLASREALVRHVASTLGSYRPDVLVRSLRLIHIPALDDEQRRSIADALETHGQTPEREWLAGVFARNLGLARPTDPPPPWSQIVLAADQANRLDDMLQKLLATEREEHPVSAAVARIIDSAGPLRSSSASV